MRKIVQFFYGSDGSANCLTDDGHFWFLNCTPPSQPAGGSGKTFIWLPSIYDSLPFSPLVAPIRIPGDVP